MAGRLDVEHVAVDVERPRQELVCPQLPLAGLPLFVSVADVDHAAHRDPFEGHIQGFDDPGIVVEERQGLSDLHHVDVPAAVQIAELLVECPGDVERQSFDVVVVAVRGDRCERDRDLWGQAAATGADLLWRAGSAFPLPVREVLADGTYLSELAPPRDKRRGGAGPITVRVVEYHLLAADGSVTETFALVTTLLDPDTAPAAELAELYHARWQIENALSALKSQLRGDGVVLRSKTPDGAEQEVWALLCAYHAIRELVCAAADLTERDPLRLSFVAALDAVRGPVGDPAAFPP